MRARLLAGVLLEHGGSPLRRALETTELAPRRRSSPVSTTAPAKRPSRAGSREARWSTRTRSRPSSSPCSTTSPATAVPREELESVLHQIELGQREITGGGFPYGLRLMVRGLGPILHGAGRARGPRHRHRARVPSVGSRGSRFIRRLVRDKLLDNPHRVRLTMAPDPELPARRAAEERERLEAIRGGCRRRARRRSTRRRTLSSGGRKPTRIRRSFQGGGRGRPGGPRDPRGRGDLVRPRSRGLVLGGNQPG